MNFSPILILFIIPNIFAWNEELVELINSSNKTWEAGPANFTLEQYLGMLGHLPSNETKHPYLIHDTIDELPKSFDARKKWPHCPTISMIYDQGNCGSCWAVSIASTISDRLCIHTNGRIKIELSAEDLLSCCTSCTVRGDGCQGGYQKTAWDFVSNIGLVTGGLYRSNEGCYPYEIPALNRSKSILVAPSCKSKCRPGYKIPFTKDGHRAGSAYHIQNNEKQIMQEIFKNGPVHVAFFPEQKFVHYKKGVYIPDDMHIDIQRGHAVKIIGWGVEKGVKYWLGANSWGIDTWGEKGFFKYIRGINALDIENNVMAGLALES